MNSNKIEISQQFANIMLAPNQPRHVVMDGVHRRCQHPDYHDIERQPPPPGSGFQNDQEGREEGDQFRKLVGQLW